MAGGFRLTTFFDTMDDMEKMRRDVVRISRLQDQSQYQWADDFVPGTMAERLRIAWDLTRDIFSIEGRYDVERRLQRHVVVLAKRGR